MNPAADDLTGGENVSEFDEGGGSPGGVRHVITGYGLNSARKALSAAG
jgi:hypothetical protein